MLESLEGNFNIKEGDFKTMSFEEQIQDFSKRFEHSKNIKTEEATKMTLILPFFQLLGYDVFNPLEFVPE